MRRLMVTAVVAAVMIGAFASFAGAFTMSERIVVANEQIAIARVPAGGLTPQERVDRVNDRLAYILGFEPLDPGSIYAVRYGGSRIIMVGDSQLITVTTADARANGMSVAELTNLWLSNAREIIPQARPTPSVPG